MRKGMMAMTTSYNNDVAESSVIKPIRAPSAQIPIEIMEDELLNAAIQTYLPSNYNFEIQKSIHHIRHYGSSCVALQMPEGLTLWATAISDIIERFTKAETVIMGDVTYGACCVDDFTARALGADLLIHYGHSCLVPVDQTSIRTLYVFVEIAIDPAHVCSTIRSNFPAKHAEFQKTIVEKVTETTHKAKPKIQIGLEDENEDEEYANRSTHLVLVATVQFINSLHALKEGLERKETREGFYDVLNSSLSFHDGQKRIEGKVEEFKIAKHNTSPTWYSDPYRITIPQIKPLSAGEILGCTSPKLNFKGPNAVDGIIYVGDGRFHLESIMISNPTIPAFRYDPYEKRFVRETYDHKLMRTNRSNAVEEAKQSLRVERSMVEMEKGDHRQGWGLVLGTLGRQGSTKVLEHLRSMMRGHPISTIPILLSELSPQKISLFGQDLVTYVQTSCPRLSIDWGDAFPKPLLSPYEAAVALNKVRSWHVKEIRLGDRTTEQISDDKDKSQHTSLPQQEEEEGEGDYPMDFYADQSLGPWTPRFGMGVKKRNPNGISNRELLKRGMRDRMAAT